MLWGPRFERREKLFDHDTIQSNNGRTKKTQGVRRTKTNVVRIPKLLQRAKWEGERQGGENEDPGGTFSKHLASREAVWGGKIQRKFGIGTKRK